MTPTMTVMIHGVRSDWPAKRARSGAWHPIQQTGWRLTYMEGKWTARPVK